MILTISIVALVLIFLVVVLVFVISRSKDDYQIDRGDGRPTNHDRGRGEGPRPDRRKPMTPNTTSRDPHGDTAYGRGRGEESDSITKTVLQETVMESDVAVDAIRVGDEVRIGGHAAGGGSIEFTVVDECRYETDQGRWRELSGRYQGRPVYLEIFPGERTVGVLLGEQALSLDAVGLTEDALVRWDEQDQPAGSFEYDGELWDFEWSGEVGCFDGRGSNCDNYYGWDFLGRTGRRMLCVEKREDSPFEVSFLHRIDMERVHVNRD